MTVVVIPAAFSNTTSKSKQAMFIPHLYRFVVLSSELVEFGVFGNLLHAVPHPSQDIKRSKYIGVKDEIEIKRQIACYRNGKYTENVVQSHGLCSGVAYEPSGYWSMDSVQTAKENWKVSDITTHYSVY